MSDVKHSIRVVAKQTGLSPHVIRTWEKRYGTTRPSRSSGNQRLYRPEDIERLVLLRRATEEGHSIGNVAGLPNERLAQVLSKGRENTQAVARGDRFPDREEPTLHLSLPAGRSPGTSEYLKAALDAVDRMDSSGLESVLDRASVTLGHMRLLSELVVPLVEEIGERWARGGFKVAHEHVATAVLRTFLGNIARPMAVHPGAPVFVVATPAGQLHELGAILAAAVAAGLGWRIVYCGPSLPAEEIAAVVIRNNARAVGLSLVHPADDPDIAPELARLRRLLPGDVAIIVGGRASRAYAAAIRAAEAFHADSLEGMAGQLHALRAASRPAIGP